jgi:hypothetical protein
VCVCVYIYIYANGAYFELRKVRVFDLKKKSVLKLLDRTVYIGIVWYYLAVHNQNSNQVLLVY